MARTETTDLGVTQLTLSNGVRVNPEAHGFDKDSINITFAVDGGGTEQAGKSLRAGTFYECRHERRRFERPLQ